jgi:alpha-tubulin suppressor-like RCC1 family protein
MLSSRISSHPLGCRRGLAVLLSLLACGCFTDPKLDPSQARQCQDDKSCPWGSVCGANGTCCESADGKTCKVLPPSDGLDATAIDTFRNMGYDVGYDGAGGALGPDGSTDAPPSDSGAGPETGATGPETAGTDAPPDLPQPIEASPADGPTDPILPPLDHPVAPDWGPDVTPDLPYGPEVTPDLPITSCVIGGTTYASGAANPANTCQICKPATSPSGWSNADEGTSCGSGQYCNSGTCKAGCFISGAYYANAAANPANACQTCQTTYATTSWTASANGANCGTGQVCSGGTCQSGCWIDGALVASGTTNQANVCQICRPTTSTSAWSNNTDGTSCGTGRICGTGNCQIGCYLGGTVYGAGGLNPANACQTCNPSVSTTAWYQVSSHCATIAAHNEFTCAISGGAAKCWGRNGYGFPGGSVSGFLGTGQSYAQLAQALTPAPLPALTSGVWAVSTGQSEHACALVNGGVQCWGRASSVGNGASADLDSPAPIASPLASGVQGIATGGSHSCAIANGQVYCWGSNGYGEIGRDPNTTTGSTTPISQNLVGNIQAITLGGNHTCVLNGGSVGCWGVNYQYELGNDANTDGYYYIPVTPVGLGTSVQAISAGYSHTCAIVNGGAWCWGANNYGQLGDGTNAERHKPVQVQGLTSGMTAISAGDNFTCAVVNGGAWCWGGNGNGQLGDNTNLDRYSPVAVYGLGSGVQAITTGTSHACALTNTGAKCWGYNGYGELGNNSSTESWIPSAVQGL